MCKWKAERHQKSNAGKPGLFPNVAVQCNCSDYAVSRSGCYFCLKWVILLKKSSFSPGKHIVGSEELQFSTQAGDFCSKYLIYFGKHQRLNGNPSASIKSAETQGLFFSYVPSWTYPTFFTVLALLLLVITSSSS